MTKRYTEVMGELAKARQRPVSPPDGLLERLRNIALVRSGSVGMAWAQILREREEAGETLSPAQKQMWRDALGER